ncbi:MAG: Xaa-Pro aminopeptidase [Bacteroidota bacterium]|nr:Xaa-Pro aminopeptidase [Bacteroidota bacterium]
MRYKKIPSSLFIDNRKKLSKRLPNNSITIICANIEYPRNGDQYFQFRQDSDFFYLTGIDFPNALLVILKTNLEIHEILFTQETNENIMLWHGPRPDKSESTEISGVRDVRWIDEFPEFLKSIEKSYQNLFLNLSAGRRMDTALKTPAQLLFEANYDAFNGIYPTDICDEIHKLRLIKSDYEIALIKKAINITKYAYEQVLKSIKPGYEYEIEAILKHAMMSQGAGDFSFAPIVASGANACILHYVNNDALCNNGSLLLMDFGAEYANYAGDCSRTIPINGTYSKRQTEIYNAVLDVYYQAQKLFKPETTIDAINKKTGEIMQKKLLNIGLLHPEEVKNQDPENPVYKRYFPHGTTHFMGIDVHDVGAKNEPLAPGMVLSCEPGIYIREEGLGVRIETDMLITENGAEDLMADFPVSIEDIENAIKQELGVRS